MSTPSDASEDTSEKMTRFPDRSMRQLLQDPEYVKYIVGLVFPEVLGLLDFSRGAQLNRTSLSPALEEREADVVVRVPFRDPQARGAGAYLYSDRASISLGVADVSAYVDLHGSYLGFGTSSVQVQAES